MNILLINKFYYEKGGADRYFFALKNLLEKNSCGVIPFAMRDKKNFKTPFDKYFVTKIQTRPSWNIWQDLKTVVRFFWSTEAQRKIRKLIRENKIDVAHVHNIYHQISPSVLPVLKKNNIPVVMTVHDYHLISTNYNLYKPKRLNTKIVQHLICGLERFWHHKILKIYQKNIDMFIVPSEFVLEKLVAAGFKENKIEVIPHFTGTLEHGNTGTREHHNNEKYILYFGRLSEEKGIEMLIEVMKDLPDINLKVAGSGPLEKEIKKQIAINKIKNVELLGYKNQDELQELILNAQFIVMPSLAPETFGLAALEAMALGKVVLASGEGALPELIKDKKMLFDIDMPDTLKQKIIMLTKNSEYVKIKGLLNKDRVKHEYSEKEHFKRITGVYRQVCK